MPEAAKSPPKDGSVYLLQVLFIMQRIYKVQEILQSNCYYLCSLNLTLQQNGLEIKDFLPNCIDSYRRDRHNLHVTN